MSEPLHFMQELACPGCGRTAYITWQGSGETRKAVDMSESLTQSTGIPAVFTCVDCGTVQNSSI